MACRVDSVKDTSELEEICPLRERRCLFVTSGLVFGGNVVPKSCGAGPDYTCDKQGGEPFPAMI